MDLSPSNAPSPIDDQVILSNHLNFQPVTKGLLSSSPRSHCEKQERKRMMDRSNRQEEQKMLKELISENSYFKMECKRLTDEIGQLKEDITWLRHCAQLPAQDLPKLDNSFSQSTSLQHDNESVSVQFSGVQMSPGTRYKEYLLNIFNEAEANNEYLTEDKENSIAGTCYDSTSITELLTKIDANEKSSVSLSDFPGLSEEECLAGGSSSLPLSICATSERIRAVHGDISATSEMVPSISRTIYILFCATIKEICNLKLEQVTEKKLLKWRDGIKDALRIGFHAEFAMEHLKKITHAYIGLVLRKDFKCIASKIAKLEAVLKTMREQQANISELSNKYDYFLEELSSESVGTGLFP